MCINPEKLSNRKGGLSSDSSTASDSSSSSETIAREAQAKTPTHSAHKRNTSYDWLIFLGPALFAPLTPVVPLYLTAVTRFVVVNLILSLHWQFVDKDNYLHKLSEKQIKREKQDYYTAFLLHMWTQIPLQLIFPNMFFSGDDMANIGQCCLEVFVMHVVLVEPLYYAVHRWLHVPAQMKAMHGFHHLSINTLPTTALVQNFVEHLVYVATFGPAFLLPYFAQGRMHWLAIAAYLIGFDIVNIFGHTNLRIRHWLFNSRWSPLTYLIYTPEFHLGHHAYFNANYSLFMPLWDYMFGTYREYKKKDVPMLPTTQQDFVFIGHNGGLGHLLTIPEICFYNVYNDYMETILPLQVEVLVMHFIGGMVRLFQSFYYCSRFCIDNQYIGRIICLARTPYDYLKPKQYDAVNRDILKLMRQEHQKYGTTKFGLGNLNKMQQLNESGLEIARMVKEDAYLKDKNICVWTGDTMTVASVYHQIADIPNLDAVYYVGAGGKVGTAVCNMLTRTKPNLKIRIFSRNQVLNHPNISYSSDLSEICNYKVALLGKILSGKMYKQAFAKGGADGACQTRYMLDYTVPAMPIAALPQQTAHIRVGLLHTGPNNAFLKGHYDLCMSHPENHIVPCHMGCILNTVRGRKTDEVGPVDLDDVETLWKMGTERGFHNIDIDYKF